MKLDRPLADYRIAELLEAYPFITQFFADEGVELSDEPEWTLGEAIERHVGANPELAPTWGAAFLDRMAAYIDQVLELVAEEVEPVRSVTIRGGRDKDGQPEPLQKLEVRVGEVLCIVGPTGSGKSRLLADIEWVAQGDTPTGRTVLINGAKPEARWRFSTEHKLVAQLSQNMSFVMDLSVDEFLALHAESRALADPEQTIRGIWQAANELAGEPFELDTPITALSGGQSRALMIADTAVLSRSPVVLIDEIENAGIDRRRALEVLIREQKIILMATHDPILALHGHRRIVLRNGAMQQIITPTGRELANVETLRAIDAHLMRLRERLRRGELLEEI